MKVIKLNRRWRQFKEHGHKMCFRFDAYSNETMSVEQALRELTNSGGWDNAGEWRGYFGKGRGYNPRPYFITFRNEDLATMVLLKIGSDAIIE